MDVGFVKLKCKMHAFHKRQRQKLSTKSA